MRSLVRWLLPALLVPLAVTLAETDAPPAPSPAPIVLQPVFVLGPDGPHPLDAEQPLRPGQVVGLALEWPPESRPARPRLARPRAEAEGGQVRARRLVPHDPRAAGRDVVEVLLTAIGRVQIPPLEILDEDGGPARHTAPVELLTESLPDAGSAEPAPPRGPRWIGPDIPGLLALAATAVLLIAAAVWWIRRRRPRTAAPIPGPPPPPPQTVALDALEALLGEGLLERGRLKAFSVRLAEIAKGYIGAIAGVSLLEKTTSECRPLLRKAGFSPELSAWLVTWLGELDMVKFAGDRPAADVLREKAEALRVVIVETSRPLEDGHDAEEGAA
ncbi:MAG TPA: hypothetical protein ENK10_06350 [Acidobacteria bacterium]|nr:hypothetical protein [Acidobacteriota bacterium]